MNTYGYIYTPDPHAYSGYDYDRIYLSRYHSLETRINELRDRLYEARPDVFVSHKNDDTDTAEKVAKTIGRCAYLS